jgi:histidinol-phosphate aminotransferase
MKVKVPFEPSLTAQVAGLRALDDDKFLTKTLQLNDRGMAFLKQEFDELNIHQIPSKANFISTVWDSDEQALQLTQSLLESGVIVRQLSGFGWHHCIRISIGLESENEKFIDILKDIL